MKTKNYLTENNKSNYNSLYNYIVKNVYPDAKKETYIYDYKKYLGSIIDNNKSWADGTKEGYFFTVAKYLRLKNPNDRYERIYAQKGHDLRLKISDDDGENQLDEKELLYYRDHHFFKNIIESIDYESIKTKQEHMKYLLLNMLVFQPPIRTSFYISAKFARLKTDNNKKDNFVHINRQGKLSVKYIVNKDKASNYKIYNINKNLSYIDVVDDKLCKLINDSYIKYPRTFLIEGLTNKPISQSTIRSYLRSITGVSGLTFNIMRASFITWFYEHHKDFNSRTKLSLIMRHSYMTALKNYNKVNLSISEDDKPSEIDKLNKEIVILNSKIKELENKLSAYEEDSKTLSMMKKKRYDVIYKANNKKVEIKEETINKYGIKMGDDGKYY